MRTFLLIFTAFIFMSNTSLMPIDNSTVKELDLNQYLGTWYEIARYDHKFERDLVGVTATYSKRKDGKIKVLNRGYKHHLDGPYSEAIGKAKIPNPKQTARLKVSFFLFFYADYLVMELDDDYQWAVIGSTSEKYLWILSRQAIMKQEQYDEIISLIEKRGYDSSKLIRVEQNPDAMID